MEGIEELEGRKPTSIGPAPGKIQLVYMMEKLNWKIKNAAELAARYSALV